MRSVFQGHGHMDNGRGAREGALSSLGADRKGGQRAVQCMSFRNRRQEIARNGRSQWTFTGARSFWRARMKARLRSFTKASRSPSDE